MGVQILTMTLALVLLPGLIDALFGPQTECRVCPDRCQTVPREGSGCPICICDGVAKEDCKRTTCRAGCRKELDAEGCNACICDPICPWVPNCPEGCEHKLNGDGCIVCDCGNNNNICEAVPACPKGCIDMRMDTKCFSCNCTLKEDTFGGQGGPFGSGGFGGRPFTGRPNNGNSFGGNANGENPILDALFGGNSFGGNANGKNPILEALFGGNPFGGNSFGGGFRDSTSGALICPVVQCPRNCRIAIDDSGCRECLCGEDAMMCPGVASCFGRCVNTNQETNCCQCTCIQETEIAISGGGSIGYNPPSVNPVEPITPVNDTSPDEECPKVGEVVCGGGCEPRAGPDGCPICDCGLMRMKPMRTVNA